MGGVGDWAHGECLSYAYWRWNQRTKAIVGTGPRVAVRTTGIPLHAWPVSVLSHRSLQVVSGSGS
jgi:hypothetical protein